MKKLICAGLMLAAGLAQAAITVSPGGGSGTFTTNEFPGEAITSGTVPDARIASTIARDSEVGPIAVAAMATNSSENFVFADYIVCEGDSLTQGNNNTAGFDYPNLLKGLLYGLTNSITITNIGNSGNTFDDVTNQFATQLYPNRPAVTGARNAWLLLWIGRNDLSGGEFPDAAAVTNWMVNLNGYIAAAQAVGFRVVLFTVTGTQFESSTLRGLLNNRIKGSATADLVFDVDNYLPDTGDETWWLTDDLHPNDAGNLFIAKKLFAALLAKTDARTTEILSILRRSVGLNNPRPEDGLDVVFDNWALIGGNNISDSTVKSMRIGQRNYDTDEEPVALINANSSSTGNALYFGGGTSVGNAVTEMAWFTTTNNNTLTGTKVGSLNAAGIWTFGNPASPSSTSIINLYHPTYAAIRFSLDSAMSQQNSSFLVQVQSAGSYASGTAANETALVARSGNDLVFGTALAATTQSIKFRMKTDGSFQAASNGIFGGSITLTNFIAMPTNYVAANFAPIAGMVKFVSSNNVVYAVTQASTNALY